MTTSFAMFHKCSLIIILGLSILVTAAREVPYLQAIHVLDPAIDEFKYYQSWNSDKWVELVRQRYLEDQENRRSTKSSLTGPTTPDGPLYGLWVNVILVASEEEINKSFSSSSKLSSKDETDHLWSDEAFPVYAVVRQSNKNLLSDGASGNCTQNTTVSSTSTSSDSAFTVFNCSNKKMFINAKVDPTSFTPISILNVFPKRVKNPKPSLRVPLVVCSKVGQQRSLLDEIKFQLRSDKAEAEVTEVPTE